MKIHQALRLALDFKSSRLSPWRICMVFAIPQATGWLRAGILPMNHRHRVNKMLWGHERTNIFLFNGILYDVTGNMMSVWPKMVDLPQIYGCLDVSKHRKRWMILNHIFGVSIRLTSSCPHKQKKKQGHVFHFGLNGASKWDAKLPNQPWVFDGFPRKVHFGADFTLAADQAKNGRFTWDV